MIDWPNVFGLWYDVALQEYDNAIRNCPEGLWEASMWDVTTDPAKPPMPVDPEGQDHPLGLPALSTFWKVAFHGLAASEWNLSGRRRNFQLSVPFSEVRAAFSPANRDDGTAKEMLPAQPPSKDDLLAYLEFNKNLVHARLGAVREAGDGQSTLGPWQGTTDTLLSMFHGNACHLVVHEVELGMFLNQHRA